MAFLRGEIDFKISNEIPFKEDERLKTIRKFLWLESR